jgi:hypothetical protein
VDSTPPWSVSVPASSVLDDCLSQGFYSCTSIMTKKQVGEERVYSAYTSILLFITKGSQDWNSSRSESRSWCWGHGGMLLTGLLPLAHSACFLIEPKTTTHNGPSHPWSLIEKMPYSWISWRHFLKGVSFLCDNSSLCQVDIQNQPLQLFSDHHNPFWYGLPKTSPPVIILKMCIGVSPVRMSVHCGMLGAHGSQERILTLLGLST